MSLILGADLSLNSSGICIIDLDKGTPIHYESVSSNLDGLERLHYNYNRYINLMKSYRDIQYIAYEGQNQRMRFSYSAGSILKIAENVGVWELAIYHSIPHLKLPPMILEVPAQDIKKFATNNGQATKEEMIAAVNGNHIKSMRRNIPEQSINDCADAYHLARMVRDIVRGNGDLSHYLIRDYRTTSE